MVRQSGRKPSYESVMIPSDHHQHGYSITELFLKVFQFLAMVGWYLILRDKFEWPFIWEAVLSIGLGLLTTWLVALGISLVRERKIKPAAEDADQAN